MQNQILSGIRVVDFTHIFAGPLATQTLGDMGAEVIKIERRGGGDSARSYGQSADEPPMSGAFLALNRNKRSLALDLNQEDGRQVAKDLLLDADVVIQNFRIGLMERWGLDYDSIAKENPSVIYGSISGFGHKGALSQKAANDLVIQGYSGLMSFTGEPDGDPVRCGTAISDFSAGLYGVIGILGALMHRARTGQGQQVFTSMLESQVSLLNYFFADYWLKGVVPKPLGTANRLGIPNQAFRTKDGWLVISAANDSMWRRSCAGLGVPELADDPRFVSLPLRYENTKALVEEFSRVTGALTTTECLAGLEAQGVSCARLNSLDEVADDIQMAELGGFIDVPRGDGGTAKVVATPLHYAETPLRVNRGVPTVGQDTEQILTELGYSAERISALRESQVI
ncbi:CaiB/BaiF CoA transferase family protein [Actinopolymorpha alba]|uniref:CaiB/BaiF CoA transferase family protein n=1 Tax=Actinopolymorpha alba TaxID=533267 RepID=UPI00036FDE60|nr:CoA transferase [Actinopolymorpha alba]